jgi:hypothetical protein
LSYDRAYTGLAYSMIGCTREKYRVLSVFGVNVCYCDLKVLAYCSVMNFLEMSCECKSAIAYRK